MAKTNGKGKTWKQHAGPYLSKALNQAARTWKPKNQRTDKPKLKRLRAARAKLNDQIRAEVEKG